MSFLLRRILKISLLGSLLFGLFFLINACNKSTRSTAQSQDLQIIFSPASGTIFSTDSIISVLVVDPSPNCKDISDGNGLLFEDTRIDKCTMTVNGMDSGSSYESGFICNEAQTQGTPLLHLPLQASVCYGGESIFNVTVTCIHGSNIITQSTATYYCTY